MSVRCETHRDSVAAWQCNVCQMMLCPDCAASRATRTAPDAVVCVHCGAPARILTKPKKIDPYWIAVGRFLQNMLTTEGLIQLSAVGLFLYLTKLIPGVAGYSLTALIFASYFFQVINRAAQGDEKLPLPADFLGAESFLVIARYSIATFLIWGPAAIYAFSGIDWWELANNPAHTLQAQFLRPGVFLLLLVGVLYYPAALIAGGVADSILAMLAPWITIRLILRIPGQYFLTVGVWLGLAGFDYVLGAIIRIIVAATPILFIPSLVGEIVQLPVRLTIAFILGRLVFQNAEHFGVVKEEMLVEPMVPGAVARGTRAQPDSRT